MITLRKEHGAIIFWDSTHLDLELINDFTRKEGELTEAYISEHVEEIDFLDEITSEIIKEKFGKILYKKYKFLQIVLNSKKKKSDMMVDMIKMTIPIVKPITCVEYNFTLC